ncbi:splicing factor u2af-associated protein 2 [Cladorrhinum sp. PSN259]|nr:splicing factor u2af-associated protein 2 [Cladorrhinum sp. PSN259]
MSIRPLITFKAGICEVDRSSKPYKVKCDPRPGYIYLFPDESELIQFCWRPRSAPPDEPELELTMVPGDGRFVPYDTRSPSESSAKTNGRIFSLKFGSSSTRHLFWLQSKPQGHSGDAAWFSPRDLKIGDIVDQILQGEEVDVNRDLASVDNHGDDSRRDADDDETMEDVEGHGNSRGNHRSGNGGAGPDATGGDFREEGEDSREGGADGARAASNNPDAAAAVRNFLESLKGNPSVAGGGQSAQGKAYPLLNDLLDSSTTIAMLDSAPDEYVDHLLDYLPPVVLVLTQQGENGDDLTKEPSAESVEAAKEAMSSDQKRALVKRVLRSPQFTQSLSSLTAALRDGGLPSVAEALGIAVANGGRVRGGTVPLGGGDAIEAFVDGVKKTVQKKQKVLKPLSIGGFIHKCELCRPLRCVRYDTLIVTQKSHRNFNIAMAQEAEYWSFPTNKEDFDQDDRISFSKLDNKYIAVQDDGTEYEFDEGLKRWVPMIDEELIEAQQRGYMMPGVNHDEDEAGPAQGRKRKMDKYSNDREQENNGRSSNKKQAKQRQPPQPKKNTAVYVTGLPLDATVDEIAELFSKKGGVIAEEIDSGRPRIKMYTDTEGNFKGDALVVFFKPQSVDMAIMLLDDTDFRFSPSGLTNGKIRVQAAEISYKKTTYDEDPAASSSSGNKAQSGESSENNNKNNKPPARSQYDKVKIIRKTQKLSAKLADWSDDEEIAGLPAPKGGKWDKVVILRHMFTLQELEEDPAALLDIKEDIREECAKLGPVTNVVLFDKEEEGIVSVRFGTIEAAEACVRLMHGRAFDGRTVEAFFATGREKFRKSRDKGGNDDGEDDDSD